jgi:hypothetical protein
MQRAPRTTTILDGAAMKGWAKRSELYQTSSTKHYNLITKTRIGQVRLINSQADLLYYQFAET